MAHGDGGVLSIAIERGGYMTSNDSFILRNMCCIEFGGVVSDILDFSCTSTRNAIIQVLQRSNAYTHTETPPFFITYESW